MKFLAVLLAVTASDAPLFEVTTVSGKQVTGELQSIDKGQWQVQVDGQTVSLPAAEILEGTVKASATGSVSEPPAHRITLLDGSSLGVSTCLLKDQSCRVGLPPDTSLALPRNSIASIRLAASPSAVDDQWAGYLKRVVKEDLLVIQKGDDLDFIPGVIGDITDQHVNLLLDGENVPVPRQRVFGVILYQRAKSAGRPRGQIELLSGDRISLKGLTLKNDTLTLDLMTGATLSIPVGGVSRIDFSFDKLAWLSALKPRDVQHEFRFISPAKPYQEDRDVWGETLRVGRQTWSRGLCVRSKTLLRYRLNGDYTRFQTWMGIQHGYRGDVRVVISADGETLLDQKIAPSDQQAQKVDLNVSDRFTLDILVDFGELQNDIGDHLVLGDARLIK